VLLIFSPWLYTGSMELKSLSHDSTTKDNSIVITGKPIRHLIFNFVLLANKTYIIYTLATVAFVSQKQEAIVNDTNTAELNRKYWIGTNRSREVQTHSSLSYFVDYRSIIGELVLMKITLKKLALDKLTLLKMTPKQ
jgi:hypothetical protein